MGVRTETKKKLVVLSGDCESANCNELHSTLDSEMFQHMGAQTATRRRCMPTCIILTTTTAYSTPDMHGFCTKNGFKIPNIIHQRLSRPHSTIKPLNPIPSHSHQGTCDGYCIIYQTYTIWARANKGVQNARKHTAGDAGVQFLTWLENRHMVHVSYCCRPTGQSGAHLSCRDTIMLHCRTQRW